MSRTAPPSNRQALLEELSAARQRVVALEQALSEQGAPAVDDATVTRTLLSHLPDYVYFKDRERRFVRFSDSFEELLERPTSEITGKRDEDLFPPEIAESTACDDRRVIEEGVPLINKLEGGVVTPGVERWVLTTKLPWRDADGTICGLFGISRDVTVQKKLEDHVRESERRLRIISDTVPFPVAATRIDDGTILYANQAFADFIAIPLDELVGARVPDYYEDARQRDALIERVRKEGRAEGVELRLRRHDGSIRVAASSVIPLEIDGTPALMGAAADITELKAREHELQELSAQKDLLLEEVDHRVRNNLATLAALIGQQIAAVGPEEHTALDRLQKSVRGLAAVHTMLSTSGWRPIELTALCHEVVQGTLSASKSPSALTVGGDSARAPSQLAHQLALVLAELATNSLKHSGMNANLCVAITVTSSTDELCITYRDNGRGYPTPVLLGTQRSHGVRLVERLIGYGLSGRVVLQNDNGAVSQLHFPRLDCHPTSEHRPQ